MLVIPEAENNQVWLQRAENAGQPRSPSGRNNIIGKKC